MSSREILTGEITSPRAKRVLYPMLAAYLINFILAAFRWQMTGYSGLTSGTPEQPGYSVVEHGRSFHVSTSQYWLGRLQIVLVIFGVLAWFIVRAYFFRTGDLRRGGTAPE